MTVNDVLSVLKDNVNVELVDLNTSEVIFMYDGRNSIPLDYLDSTIESMWIFARALSLGIYDYYYSEDSQVYY